MFKDNKRLVTESIFIKEALKEKLSLNEFLLLVYFDNSDDLVFDVDSISRVLSMDKNDVIGAYASLINKKLINVKAVKDGYGKIVEKVSLDKFYNEIKTDNEVSIKNEEKNDIFSIFESSFGRTLSSMDYEIINAWIDKGFSEETIISALKEAVLNGVPNLRYIDKVLFEWERKGIKNTKELNCDAPDDNPFVETTILNFDWLNEK